MPGLGSSAFSIVETVLNKARAILNDAEVPGGDVLTDSYAGLFPLANTAYDNIQKRLASAGVETFSGYAWLINVPAVSGNDPETRVTIRDDGTSIVNPTGVGGSNFAAPILPADLILPLKLWERQNGTTNEPVPMKEPNDGLRLLVPQNFLIQWEWGSYQTSTCIILCGALQAQDIKCKYERRVSVLASINDPVPIRGVDNAAAYQIAKIFAAGRGSTVAAAFSKEGDDEIEQLEMISARKAQRKRVRRIPYSGRGSRIIGPF
jgi:hypothetical protein